MTRKDFILISLALRESRPKAGAPTPAFEAWEAACDRIAWRIARENPRFDPDRFLTECECE